MVYIMFIPLLHIAGSRNHTVFRLGGQLCNTQLGSQRAPIPKYHGPLRIMARYSAIIWVPSPSVNATCPNTKRSGLKLTNGPTQPVSRAPWFHQEAKKKDDQPQEHSRPCHCSQGSANTSGISLRRAWADAPHGFLRKSQIR